MFRFATVSSLSLLVFLSMQQPAASASKLLRARARTPKVAPCGGQAHCLEIRLQTTVVDGKGKRPPADDRVVLDRAFAKRARERFGASSKRLFRVIGLLLRKTLRSRDPAVKEAASRSLGELVAAGVYRGYRVRRRVKLTKDNEAIVARIAARFFLDTGRELVVTSGLRDANTQARAMYVKRSRGGSLVGLYRNKIAIGAIEQAYQQGVKKRQGADAIVARMAKVIAGQIARGVYISRHLQAGAVDIRSRTMSVRDHRAFRQAAAAEGARVLLERRPPHYHVRLPAAEPNRSKP